MHRISLVGGVQNCWSEPTSAALLSLQFIRRLCLKASSLSLAFEVHPNRGSIRYQDLTITDRIWPF